MISNEKIISSMSIVYGSPPYGWVTASRLEAVQALILMLPKVHGRDMLLTTYLLFARSSLRFDNSANFDAVFSDKMKSAFIEHTSTLRSQAPVQVALDGGNFRAEVTAFSSMELAITDPHLDVSALYRYMVAIQRGMLMCVDDTLVEEAVSALRTNPFLYFAYGDDFIPYMPIAWEDL